MGTLLSYSLVASVFVLALFPLLHQIVGRCTSFRFNRFAIICGLLLSLSLPCVLTDSVKTSAAAPVVNLESTTEAGMAAADAFSSGDIISGTPEKSIPWVAIALAVYFSGIAILLCRETISYLRLYRMITRAEKTKSDGMTICRLPDNETASFSWGRYIFMHDSDMEEPAGKIFLHEKAHAQNRHWMDLLFADLSCILLWYNPFVWMTRRLMKLNHEFEADSAVISSGVDTYEYQRLLVMKAMGRRAIPVTNSFAVDRRDFRKRVLLMGKKRSSAKTMLIAFGGIPAVIAAWIAISSPVAAGLLESINDFDTSLQAAERHSVMPHTDIDVEVRPDTLAEEGMATVIEIASPLWDQTELAELIRSSLSSVKSDRERKITIGIVVDKDGSVKDVMAVNADGELVEAVVTQALNGVRIEPVTDNGKPIEMRFNIPVTIKKTE